MHICRNRCRTVDAHTNMHARIVVTAEYLCVDVHVNVHAMLAMSVRMHVHGCAYPFIYVSLCVCV